MSDPASWDQALVTIERTATVVDTPRAAVAAGNLATGRRILVLDDDPTGSQAVHDIEVVTSVDREAITRSLAGPGSACFVLTNSRSLSEADAAATAYGLGLIAAGLEERTGGHVEIVSRSDSTLRGHVTAEIEALQSARRAATGAPADVVIFAPAFFEAGRFTAGDVHWARVGDEMRPVASTEFAHDRTFGYSSSALPDFLAEVSRGRVAADDVVSIPLAEIRTGGPGRVAEILLGVEGGRYVVVNADSYEDFDVVVLGIHLAEDAGRSFLYRTGPSFVRSLTGLGPKPPLTTADIFGGSVPDRHGLVVVGSHVELTTRQVAMATGLGGIDEIVVDAGRLATGDERYISGVARSAAERLRGGDVLLSTSRALVTGATPDEQLAISRAVSAGVTAIARSVVAERPGWVIAKGGITSHDVLVQAMGVRRARILGQLFPGQVSVFSPVEVTASGLEVPCSIFPGNVGTESSLASAIKLFGGRRR